MENEESGTFGTIPRQSGLWKIICGEAEVEMWWDMAKEVWANDDISSDNNRE